jgi:hypothetical protein
LILCRYYIHTLDIIRSFPLAFPCLQGASGHHDVMVAREQAGGLALEQGRDPGQAQEPGGRVVDILTADDEPVFSSDEEDLPGDQLHYLDVVSEGCHSCIYTRDEADVHACI